MQQGKKLSEVKGKGIMKAVGSELGGLAMAAKPGVVNAWARIMSLLKKPAVKGTPARLMHPIGIAKPTIFQPGIFQTPLSLRRSS